MTIAQLKAPYQKGGDGHSNDKAGDYIRPVVAVLCHSVDAREEGQAHQPKWHDRFGQPGSFSFHSACDVHLKWKEKESLFMLSPSDKNIPLLLWIINYCVEC